MQQKIQTACIHAKKCSYKFSSCDLGNNKLYENIYMCSVRNLDLHLRWAILYRMRVMNILDFTVVRF